MKAIALGAMACALCTALPSYAGNACAVKSGSATAALVELYTSEGCSNCPPADRQLSRLREQLGAHAAIVPLELHVSYWDDIGWKDPFAQKIFDARQSHLLANRQSRIVYTPQFFVNGSELRGWRDRLPAAIRSINAVPAPLTIALKTASTAADSVTVEADVTTRNPDLPAQTSDAALYVAISENGLSSQVLRGENGGATLKHDDTVRAWFGPLQLAQGRGHFQQNIKIPAGWKHRNLQAVAFVQDQRDGSVLQVVSTESCNQTRGL